MRRPLALLAGTALAACIALTGVAAHAAAPPPPTPVADGLFTPLKLALDLDGSVYVTQNFLGQLTKISRDGTTTTVHTTAREGAEVGGVSAFLGSVYFTETVLDAQQRPLESYLMKRDRRGTVTQLADIRAFENATNPDGKTAYGFTDLPADCLAQLPEGFPASYTGIQDSHPYATLGTPIGTVVADAGSNALFTVDNRGKVRTLAVFPAQPVEITQALPEQGFPACTVGHTYNFEAVPTDVELGPDGQLYVTLLPGGPEDASLGARGSVVKVNLLTGRITPVADGLVSATDLAVSPRGDVYVAQLFGAGVAVIPRGSSEPVPFRDATSTAAVEWAPRGIYATVGAFPPGPTGQVVVLPF